MLLRSLSGIVSLLLPTMLGAQTPNPATPQPAAAPKSSWSTSASLTVKETFDSNVYLQDTEPSPGVINAVRPFQESLVTAVTPRVALDWQPMPEFNLAFSYAPEVVRFHAEPSENYVAHRVALSVSGQVRSVTWEQFNTLNWIDGSDEGLTFGGPGGVPAIGGIPLRDRRDALIYRNGFRAFHPRGRWFFRPAVSSYVHDFQTRQRNIPGYQNYLDRNDFALGLDGGYLAFRRAYLVLAYRYGFQHQTPLPWSDIHYSNDYHRLLLGLEGRLADWLKVTMMLGPDFRDFTHEAGPSFDIHHVRLYYDASVVLTPAQGNTVTLTARQFEQPAFGAPSVYEDITWEIVWRHEFTSRLAAGTGFRVHVGDWLPPVAREDWIYTTSATVNYTHNRHWSGEVSYSYDWVDSRVPNTAGREFTRHLVSLGVKYTF